LWEAAFRAGPKRTNATGLSRGPNPDDYDPSVEDEAMGRDIDVLNEEMIAAGIRVFVGGLHPVKSAKSLRAQPGGKVLITDGPYLETNHVDSLQRRSTRLLLQQNTNRGE